MKTWQVAGGPFMQGVSTSQSYLTVTSRSASSSLSSLGPVPAAVLVPAAEQASQSASHANNFKHKPQAEDWSQPVPPRQQQQQPALALRAPQPTAGGQMDRQDDVGQQERLTRLPVPSRPHEEGRWVAPASHVNPPAPANSSKHSPTTLLAALFVNPWLGSVPS